MKTSGIITEFKKFAMRGNVTDMAVGVIIGGAFGSIVSSVVSDVIMPPVGLLLGGMDFSDLAITLKQATADQPAVVLGYGKFIQTTINFLIIAWAVFLLVKIMSRLEHRKAEEPATPPTPSNEEVLLTDIRDLLKEQNTKKQI